MSARPNKGLGLVRDFGRDRSGTSAVEFAFVLPAFILMIFGLFQYCWAQHCLSSVRFALEKASRSLLLNTSLTQDQLKTIVVNQLNGTADSSNVTVTLSTTTNSAGNKIATLTGTYTTTIGVPTLASFPLSYSTSVVTPLPSF